MLIYRRNIHRKLFFLRVSSILLSGICTFTFFNNNTNLGYFLVVVLMVTAIIVVNNFMVFIDSYQIIKYYLFGFIKITSEFNRNQSTKISSHGSDFGKEFEAQDGSSDSSGSGMGCIFSLFFIFNPPKAVTRKIGFETFDIIGNTIMKAEMHLNKQEFSFLQPFIKSANINLK